MLRREVGLGTRTAVAEMSSERKTRVLLVDDHPVFREGLRSILQCHDLQVVAEAETLADALAKLDLCNPDVVVTDLVLGDDSGRELIREVRRRRPGTPILVISMLTEPSEVIESIQAGAQGYLTKGASRDEFVLAVAEVMAGRSYLHPSIAHHVFARVRSREQNRLESVPLTVRERDILSLLVQEHTPRQVADALFISETTVKTHMRGLYRKLEVNNLASLVLKAIRLGLVS